MIPYSRQLISKSDIASVNKVLKSDFLTQGPNKKKFENLLSKTCGVKYSSTFNSATSALHIACLALGVGRGDEVWTCTNSFVASANCALYCQAKIDLVDIDPSNFNMCMESLEKKLSKAKKRNKLPKVIIPIHFGGLPPNLKKLKELKKKYKFKIIEDASHSIGGMYLNKRVGDCSYSDITVFSFHPVKIITTAEGGAALTNNKKIYQKLNQLGAHGITRDNKFLNNKKKDKWYYEHQALGYNYRLNDIQSALGITQLKNLNKWVKTRNRIARNYIKSFKDLPLDFQKIEKGLVSAYHLFVIVLRKNKKKITRDKIYKHLKKNNILTNVHYIPIHKQPFFRQYKFKKKDFINAEYYYENCLSLPMFAGLKMNSQKKVIRIVRNLFIKN